MLSEVGLIQITASRHLWETFSHTARNNARLGGVEVVYTVTHPGTNRARRRTTALIDTNALPLNQTAILDFDKCLTDVLLNHMQQAALACRVVAGHALPKDTHSRGILKYLHWIWQRIKFKFATLTHTRLSVPLSPLTITPFWITTSNICSLRSANTCLFSVSRVRTTKTTGGKCSFFIIIIIILLFI